MQILTSITEKDNKPVDEEGSQTYTDEKLIEIIDQSLKIMDTDYDGYVSFPEFVKTQQDMKNQADSADQEKWPHKPVHSPNLPATS